MTTQERLEERAIYLLSRTEEEIAHDKNYNINLRDLRKELVELRLEEGGSFLYHIGVK